MLGRVLLLTIDTRWTRLRKPRSIARLIVVLLALCAIAVVLLRLHHEWRCRHAFGPPDRAPERALAVERDTFKESFRYSRLYLGDELRFDLDVPTGGWVEFEGWRVPSQDGEIGPVSLSLVARRRGGLRSHVARRTLGPDSSGWNNLGRFTNDGEAAGFRLSLKSSPAVTSDQFRFPAWFRTIMPAAAWRPWAPMPDREVLLVRWPRVEIPQDPDLPNVIYISIDTLRADHLGGDGYHRDTTPNLDRFARENTHFNRAYSTDTWTLPSHMTALSSLYTSSHGVCDPGMALTEIDFPTVQAVLAERHYRTAAITDGGAVSARYGFDVGFDEYFEEVGVLHNPGMRGMSRRTVDKIEKWLDGHAGGPFFLFIHSHEVHHFPNVIPEHAEVYAEPGYDGFFALNQDGDTNFVDRILQAENDDTLVDGRDVNHAVDLYDGGIRVVDREIGRLFHNLRHRGLYDDTLIIVASDHGESFRDFHDGDRELLWYHFRPPYIEQIRVPLIIKFPRRMNLAGASDADVSLLDLAPTILDVVGVPPPGSFQGSTLLPLLRGDQSVVDHPIIAERVPPARKNKGQLWVTVIDGGRKVILRTAVDGSEVRTEFYDLERDPMERVNLSDDPSWNPREWTDLVAVAAEHLASVLLARGRQDDQDRQPVDEEHLEQLKALGYVR